MIIKTERTRDHIVDFDSLNVGAVFRRLNDTDAYHYLKIEESAYDEYNALCLDTMSLGHFDMTNVVCPAVDATLTIVE